MPTPTDNTDVTGVCIALVDDTLDLDQTWTNIDAYVAGWSTRRGRQFERDKNQTGTATITLRDTTGRFDVTNLLSPINLELLVLKQVRIAPVSPVTGDPTIVFSGYVEGYDQTIDTAEKMVTTTITLVDGSDILANTEVVPDSSGQANYDAAANPRDRMLAALGDAGWKTSPAPAGLTDIFTGNVYVKGQAYQAGTDILRVCQDAADAEFPGVSNFLMSKLGYVTFRGRQARFRPYVAQYGVGKWHVGDRIAWLADPTIARISQIGWSLDKTHLVNSCLATPMGIPKGLVAGQLKTAPASITSYGTRVLTLPNLLTDGGIADGLNDRDEVALFGQYYVDNYAIPTPRISKLVFTSQDPTHSVNDATWAFMLGVEIGDLLYPTATFPGGGGFVGAGFVDHDIKDGFFVEGIRNEVTHGNGTFPQWAMTLDVSPQALYDTNPFDVDPDPGA